jgi:hypothetical protein
MTVSSNDGWQSSNEPTPRPRTNSVTFAERDKSGHLQRLLQRDDTHFTDGVPGRKEVAALDRAIED